MYQIVKMREEVKYSLRQSMWKKTKNVLDIVKTTGVITIPGFHYYEDIIHLIDINSGEIIEFVDKDIEELQEKIAKKLGYNLVDHKLELYGSKIKK